MPVLGRPANAQPLVDSIHENTVSPHTIIFLCTRGDTQEIEACKATGAVVHLVEPGRGEYPRKINTGATLTYTDHPWLFLGADDLQFAPNWDIAALNTAERTGKLVIGTQDGGNPSVKAGKHATHSLVARSYAEIGTIDEPGKLLYEYDHNFCDTEFVETAKARDQWTFAHASVVTHLHPFWRKGADDPVYAKGRATYKQDEAEFFRRRPLWSS